MSTTKKRKEITTQSILEEIAGQLQLKHEQAIVLINSAEGAVTVTIPRGNYVEARWCISVAKVD